MESRLVEICSFQFAYQADVAKFALENEGISAFVEDANTITADWLLGNALGWIKLKVAEKDAPAAAAVLQRHPQLTRPSATPPEGKETPFQCLACGAVMDEEVDNCVKCGWSYLEEGNEASN